MTSVSERVRVRARVNVSVSVGFSASVRVSVRVGRTGVDVHHDLRECRMGWWLGAGNSNFHAGIITFFLRFGDGNQNVYACFTFF